MKFTLVSATVSFLLLLGSIAAPVPPSDNTNIKAANQTEGSPLSSPDDVDNYFSDHELEYPFEEDFIPYYYDEDEDYTNDALANREAYWGPRVRSWRNIKMHSRKRSIDDIDNEELAKREAYWGPRVRSWRNIRMHSWKRSINDIDDEELAKREAYWGPRVRSWRNIRMHNW